MQSPALFQNISKFCILFALIFKYFAFFALFLPIFWKMARMPLLSRIEYENISSINHVVSVHQKLGPDFYFILVNIPKQYCMRQILFKIICFERGLSKSFKNVNSIFSFEPNPF